jgi:uncharacterized integral membrane protein
LLDRTASRFAGLPGPGSGDAGGVETTRRPTAASRTHWGRIVVAVVLVAVIAAVAIDNRDDTRIGYVFGDVNAPLFVVLIAAAIAGAIIGWLLMHRPHRHQD